MFILMLMLMLLFSDLDFDVDTFGGSCVVVDGSVVCGGNVGDIVFVVSKATSTSAKNNTLKF